VAVLWQPFFFSGFLYRGAFGSPVLGLTCSPARLEVGDASEEADVERREEIVCSSPLRPLRETYLLAFSVLRAITALLFLAISQQMIWVVVEVGSLPFKVPGLSFPRS